MRLLDLFCGAGGAAVGYAQAGFTDIIGIDSAPQPRYPFVCIQTDALDYLKHATGFDAIHASPPEATQTRRALADLAVPWVLEVPLPLVEGSALLLCGALVGLPRSGHRAFACQPTLALHTCACDLRSEGRRSIEGPDLGIDWMAPHELAQAIPPAYTALIGRHVLHTLAGSVA